MIRKPKVLNLHKIELNLCLINMLAYISYLLPMNFYPDIGYSKGVGLPFIGFINALFPIGGAIVSTYLGWLNLKGKTMGKLGKKRILYLGSYCLVFSMALLSFTFYIKNTYLFMFISIVARLIQGMAVSMICKF